MMRIIPIPIYLLTELLMLGELRMLPFVIRSVTWEEFETAYHGRVGLILRLAQG